MLAYANPRTCDLVEFREPLGFEGAALNMIDEADKM